MREILFRGKSLETGKWVQGYLFKHWGKAFILWGTNNGQPTMNEVNPNTVGQYTGLKNKNGTKIFEGDILKRTDSENELINICWDLDRGGFLMCYIEYDECYNLEELPSCEIIGNIHDNPELLEVEE